MNLNIKCPSNIEVALLLLLSVVFLGPSSEAQEKILIDSTVDICMDSVEPAQSTSTSGVEVRIGNHVLTEGLDYVVENQKIRIISEEYEHSLLPVSVSFQRLASPNEMKLPSTKASKWKNDPHGE